MIFSIGILLFSSVILLISDRHSRYMLFFVLMALGSILSLFSLVFHVSTFGNYYSYTTNPFHVLDYRLYAWLVQRLRLPLKAVFRFMNAGMFLYQLSNCLFALELRFCLRWYRVGGRASRLVHTLVFAIPVLTLIFCDPLISNRIYIFCHLHAGVYPYLQLITALYKALALAAILLPVCDLIAYARVIRLPYLCKRIAVLATMLTVQHTAYVLMFYFGSFSISAEKVYRSGYWIFESQQFNTHAVYSWLPVITLFLMIGCLIVLLSFRLDPSMRLFPDRTIQKNLTLMNHALGDLLHSHKNQLFTQHIYIEKLKKRPGCAELPEVRKLDGLVSKGLEDTARLLDRLNDQSYKFKPCTLSAIIGHAVEGTFIPENVELKLDDTVSISPSGYFDRYHLEQALINLLNNAVDAVVKAKREHPVIRISMAYFFRWIVIVISDNGVGISPAEKRRLFLPHYSTKNGRLNWGLGLTYVYRIIDAHLGQIKISSRKGEYTSVMLMLPSVDKEKTV